MVCEIKKLKKFKKNKIASIHWYNRLYKGFTKKLSQNGIYKSKYRRTRHGKSEKN